MAVYGRSFLTKPISFTQNKTKAEGSIFEYRSFKDVKGEYVYYLSWLGVINGLLPFFYLTPNTNDDREILGYRFLRKR